MASSRYFVSVWAVVNIAGISRFFSFLRYVKNSIPFSFLSKISEIITSTFLWKSTSKASFVVFTP